MLSLTKNQIGKSYSDIIIPLLDNHLFALILESTQVKEPYPGAPEGFKYRLLKVHETKFLSKPPKADLPLYSSTKSV